MRIANAFITVALLMTSVSPSTFGQKRDQAEVSLAERVFVASKIYASIPIYFAHWQSVPNLELDDAYKKYIAEAIAAPDRFAFDLASIEFVATLHNAHSGFDDDWLDKNYGRVLGFYARPLDGRWVVTESAISDLKVGDIIERLDGAPIEEFYRKKERWLSGSSDKEKHQTLFWRRYLFPEAFTLTLDGGRSVSIDRSHLVLKDFAEPPKPTLKSGIQYMKISSFGDPKFEAAALDSLREHKGARVFIIDLRGNGGGSTPTALIRALMDRPYRSWSEETPLTIGLLRSYQDLLKMPDLPKEVRDQLEAMSEVSYQSRLRWDSTEEQPEEPTFTGKLFLLVDGACASACEDFVVPFKDNHRATIVGENTEGTSGQPYIYAFGNGMSFRIGTKREFLPDGTAFEGIGIKPDVEVPLTLQDLRSGRDSVLLKAEELAGGNS